MTAPVRLVAFALVLVLLFGGGVALGGAVGPFGDDPPRPAQPSQPSVDHEAHP